MKIFKFLSIPMMALGMVTLLTATASANHAQISAALDCSNTTAGKVCFNLSVSTQDIPQGGRQITVTLLAHKKGDASTTFSQVGQTQTIPVQNNMDNVTVPVCFDNVMVSNFDSFKLELKPVGPDFDINGGTDVKVGPFENTCQSATPTPTPPTPTSSGSGGGSPSPSANTTVALAQTGGFDFRYPLIGLVLLVAGGALFVVSASRGRSSASK